MKCEKRKAIVFGITGQIGSYLLDKLLEQDFYVCGVARRVSFNNTQRIEHHLNNKNFNLVGGDVTDFFSIINIFNSLKQKFSSDSSFLIFNMAAQSFVFQSFNQPLLTFDVTCKGVLNILEGIRATMNIDRVKFIQMSSSEMFGSNVNSGGSQCETTPFKPNSPYGIAKLAAHCLVDVYKRSYGINGGCVIAFNNESPRRGEEFVTRKITKWIGEFVANNRTYKNKLKLGNLLAYRDWSHSKDIVEAIYLISQTKLLKDYAVSSGQSFSIEDFVEAAFNIIGIKNYKDYIEIDENLYRPCEVPYLKGDSKKIKAELGWNPQISFEELVKEMVTSDIVSYVNDKYTHNLIEELSEK